MGSEMVIPEGRRKLALVVRGASDVIEISDAERILDITRIAAAKLLSRWSQQGWLRRVGPGLYVPVNLDSLVSENVIDDHWILVPALYDPSYIGGRTAAEHWGLTDQIFRDIVVMTGCPVRVRTQRRAGAIFTLRHIQLKLIWGTKCVWRGSSRISVSDVHRTIVDLLDDPTLGGGIQHVDDCLRSYFSSHDRNDDRLLAYADRMGNGAVFKRLGFLVERVQERASLAEACHERLTQGNAKLDPALPCRKLISRWRLFVPESWYLESST